jgi:hypothetical protein
MSQRLAANIHASDVYFPPYRDREVYEKFRDGVIAAGLPA